MLLCGWGLGSVGGLEGDLGTVGFELADVVALGPVGAESWSETRGSIAAAR